MTNKKLLLTIGFSVLSLFLIAGTTWYFIQVRPVEIAKKLVSDLLIDKESARFEEVVYNRNSSSVCGYVNAKNKMGGYVGEKRFMVSEGKARIEPNEPDVEKCGSPSFSSPSYYGGSVENYALRSMESMISNYSSAEKYNQCLENIKTEIDILIEFIKEAKKKCYADN